MGQKSEPKSDEMVKRWAILFKCILSASNVPFLTGIFRFSCLPYFFRNKFTLVLQAFVWTFACEIRFVHCRYWL